MASIERTAYPCFRMPLTPTELRDHFTPTTDEVALASKKTREPAALLTLLALQEAMETCIRLI